jgi:hypothetical protein
LASIGPVHQASDVDCRALAAICASAVDRAIGNAMSAVMATAASREIEIVMDRNLETDWHG